jgi:prevent-host-death family protein
VSETSVGVRKLKEHLSEYLRLVKMGEAIVITDHGQPVGRIVPVDQPLEAKLQAMIEAGSLAWSGQKLEPMVPVTKVQGEGSVADLLVEDRG